MRTLLQLLLISTVALTRVMTTKAKIEGITSQPQNLSNGDDPDEPPPYGSPWNSDQADGHCPGTDQFNDLVTKEGFRFGQCMPQIPKNGNCLQPVVPYADNLDGKVFLKANDGRNWYCAEECSMEGAKCPSGSECQPVLSDLEVPGFTISTNTKNICYFKQPGAPGPPTPPEPTSAPYEAPKNGACDDDEKIHSFETDGVKYAQCMSKIPDHGNCPSPYVPYKDMLDGKVFLKSDRIWYCVAECSELGSKCPSGSTCMAAPKDAQVDGFIQSPDSKNICYFNHASGYGPGFDYLNKRMDEMDKNLEKKLDDILSLLKKDGPKKAQPKKADT